MNGTMRHIVGLALALLIALMGARAMAHDGDHSPDMLAEVITATQEGNRVAVSLLLTGLGGPLVLVGTAAQGAKARDMRPIYVNFAQDVSVMTVLEFPGPPPGIFTLELDFGPTGRGAVSVIPEPGRIIDPN